MSNKRSNIISTLGSKITTVISVGLVLLIVGILLIISLLTSGAGDALRQRVAVIVRLDNTVTPDQITEINSFIAQQPYTASLTYISAEDILTEESQYEGDILALLDENPFSPEYELFLKPDYVNTANIKAISAQINALPGVEEVYSQVDVIDKVNAFLHDATLVLAGIGVIFLVISIILLVNTISLMIYSKRFVIHTMQLVGATRGFVRWPIVRTGALLGLISAILASVMLCALYLYAMHSQIDNLLFIGWGPTAGVCAVMAIIGILLCGTASYFTTNRFLNSSYDKLHSM